MKNKSFCKISFILTAIFLLTSCSVQEVKHSSNKVVLTNAVPELTAATDEVSSNVPVTVVAQQAVYEKHKCIHTEIIFYEVKQTKTDELFGTGTRCSGFTGYNFNEKTGVFNFNGYTQDNIVIGDVNTGVTGASQVFQGRGSNSMVMFQAGDWCVIDEYTITSIKKTGTEYSQGEFLTDVTADNGSLPVNGRHTDGYWYVFKNLVQD